MYTFLKPPQSVAYSDLVAVLTFTIVYFRGFFGVSRLESIRKSIGGGRGIIFLSSGSMAVSQASGSTSAPSICSSPFDFGPVLSLGFAVNHHNSASQASIAPMRVWNHWSSWLCKAVAICRLVSASTHGGRLSVSPENRLAVMTVYSPVFID